AVARIDKGPGIYKWDDSAHNWAFQISGIATGTAMPTSPATGDYFQLTKAITGPPAFATGIYRWNGSSWVFKGDGTSLPDSPATNDYFRLAEHDISAEAESGSGGDSSKVSIAGALGLNIISNHTEAIVSAGATVNAHAGGVTLIAKSNEEDGAKGDSDAKAGKVGIGASAAIQVLTDNVTRAAIEDGATISCAVAGCGALTI